ncbi:MAG: STAS domain-containing protein, partial [Paracoccaceae bacterium]|nr:STAS domain-containing protein [Paracoccaceae bacterium]
ILAAKRLNYSEAAHLFADLKAAREHDVQVDGSSVEMIGTWALQLLLAAQKGWSADGKKFVISPQSKALSSALALSGIPKEMFLPGVQK